MKHTPEGKVHIGFQAPDDLQERLRAEAKRQDRSVSWIVIAAIEAYLKKQQPEFSSRMKK